MMKNKAKLSILISACLSVNGCSTLQTNLTLLNPNTKVITLKHVRTLKELREIECGIHPTEYNCAYWVEGGNTCTIVIFRPKDTLSIIPMFPKDQWSRILKLEGKEKQDFLDRYYMLSLGHELRHCFEGQWH